MIWDEINKYLYIVCYLWFFLFIKYCGLREDVWYVVLIGKRIKYKRMVKVLINDFFFYFCGFM